MTESTAGIALLQSALAALIARVERTGGYAGPEEQDVLRAAREALAGVPGKSPGIAQERSAAGLASAAPPDATGQPGGAQ